MGTLRVRFESRTAFLKTVSSGALLLGFVVSCGEPGPGAGDAEDGRDDRDNRDAEPAAQLEDALKETRPAFELAAPEEFYRLDLRRTGDRVELQALERVELPFIPTPALSPEFMVVGMLGDDVISAVPVAFPTTLRASSLQEGALVHAESEVEEPRTTVYLSLPSELESLQILAPGGDVVFETTDLPPKAAKRTARPPEPGTKTQAISREQLAFRYAHIRFLAPGDESKLDPALLADPSIPGSAQIVMPSSSTDEVLAAGLARVAPGLLSSVSTIAVVQWPSGHPYASSILGIALGPELVLNADLFHDKDEMVLTVVHEIAHNFTFLCNAGGKNSGFSPQDWPSHVSDAARVLLQRFQLASGLDAVFQGLHESGIPEGWTMPYTLDQTTWTALSLADAQAGGFASPYGSVNPWEDIAEYVGSVQAPTPTTPGICPSLKGVSELPENLSIPYAKLTLLRGLGALDADAFKACAGSIATARSEGIHFPQIEFTGDLKAGTLTLNGGGPGFAIYGAGPNTYEMLIEFPLREKGATPLGIHRFDSVWALNFGDGNARVLLGHEDNFRVRASDRGMVVVTEASSQRVSGFVFGLVLQNAGGLPTDYMPFGTFLVR